MKVRQTFDCVTYRFGLSDVDLWCSRNQRCSRVKTFSMLWHGHCAINVAPLSAILTTLNASLRLGTTHSFGRASIAAAGVVALPAVPEMEVSVHASCLLYC
jgi:hypothetical protein